MQRKKPELCRALNTHAWEIVGPIVILKGNERRVTLHCERCDTWRSDKWSRAQGAIVSRYYKHEKAYKFFIKEHSNADARMAILANIKEIPDEANRPALRLVQAPKKVRRRHTKSHKRPRDKRWSAARSVRRAQ